MTKPSELPQDIEQTEEKTTIVEIPEDILELLTDRLKEDVVDVEKYDSLENYLIGEHFQDGEGWIGPVVTTEKLKDELSRGFVADGLIRQAVRRYALAVVGRDPEFRAELRTRKRPETVEDDFGVKKTVIPENAPAEITLIQEAEDAITGLWFDRPEMRRSTIQMAVRVALHNLAFLRVYQPDDIDEYVDQSDVNALVKTFEVHCPDNYEANVVRNEHGRVKACWYLTEDGYIVSWIDRKTGETVTAETDSNFNVLASQAVMTGQRLPIIDLKDAGIIYPSVISQQKLVDYDTNMLKFNNLTGAFRQQLMINAQEPEEEVTLADGTVEIRKVPLDTGVGAVAWLYGAPREDPLTGDVKGYETPNVIWKDPINQDGLLSSISHNVKRFYENVYQAHVLISGDANSSGTSRQQAVQDHIMSLEQLQQEVEGALRWMFELMLKWSATLMGDPNRYDTLKMVVKCRVTAVQPTSEERSAILAEYNAGLRSKETTMALLGVSDVDAEMARIDAEKSNETAAQQMAPGVDPSQVPGADKNNPFATKKPSFLKPKLVPELQDEE